MSITVGFQGSDCSFTNKAALSFFGRTPNSAVIQYSSVPSCRTIFEHVASGKLSYGVLPVESSSHGTMPMYLETLLKHSQDVRIVGETIEREHQCLCAQAGTTEASITRIISHPVILEDCSIFIDALAARSGLSIEQCAASDSAAACMQLCAAGPCTSAAVICSREAATLHGLQILSQSVGNDRNSETRYIIIANAAGDALEVAGATGQHPDEKLKGSLTLSIKNAPGSMFKMMSCFSLRDINVLKIESRPSSVAIGLNDSVGSVFRHWDTIFFVDYEVSQDAVVNAAFWNNLHEYCDWARPLGEYKKFGQQHATITERVDWNTMVDILATA